MLTYFIRNLLVFQVLGNPKPLIFQLFDYILDVICLRIGDIEHRNLNWSQPNRQGACVLFYQNSYETLQASNDSSVQHDGPVTRTIFTNIFSAKPLRHIGVHLHGAALPFTTNRVFQGVFNFWAVKRALAWQVLEVAT